MGYVGAMRKEKVVAFRQRGQMKMRMMEMRESFFFFFFLLVILGFFVKLNKVNRIEFYCLLNY